MLAGAATLAVAGVCSPHPSKAAAAERSAPNRIAIVNARILDGRGGHTPIPGTVLIEDGKIAAISGAKERPAAATVIDAGGNYLLPGFVDAHVHILVPRCWSYSSAHVQFDRALSEKVLSKLLDFGITTVRSPATPTVEGLALRDDLNAGKVRGPRALASAEFLNDPTMPAEALRAYMRDALPSRPDYFKVYARLSPEQIKTVIEEAHALGVKVIGHLGRTSWTEAARMRIDFVTHGADWSEKTLKAEYREAYRHAIAERGAMRARLDWLEWLDLDSEEVTQMIDALAGHRVPVDPTLVAYDAKFSDPDYPAYRSNANLNAVPELPADWRTCKGYTRDWTEADFAKWRRLLPKLQRLVRKMHEGGVLLLTGSDTTNEWVIPGESLHQEFELLAGAGIPPNEILKMTGKNASTALDLDGIGIIEEGRNADLVLLSGNPLDDIANTRRIEWVMQGGKIVAGKSMD